MTDENLLLPKGIKEEIIDRARLATSRQELASTVSSVLLDFDIDMRLLPLETVKDLVVNAARASRIHQGLRVIGEVARVAA